MRQVLKIMLVLKPIISKLVSARGEPSDCLIIEVFKCLKSEISQTPDLFPSVSYF